MSIYSDIQGMLAHIAYNMRLNVIAMTTRAGSGHPTSALSAADIVSALFFYGMNYDPLDPNNAENDRFILSKGHASPILYAVWRELGILTDHDLLSYRSLNSILEGHPTTRFNRVEAATGSLGMGLSIGAGMALYAKMFQKNFLTYVLLGDGELAEGSVWEAAEIADFYSLNNLIAFVDANRLGQSTQSLHGYNLQRYANKFHAFGWHSLIIDGHDIKQITDSIDHVKQCRNKPTIIIAKTIKGYGVDQVANKEGFHGKVFKQKELDKVYTSIKSRFYSTVHKKACNNIDKMRYITYQKSDSEGVGRKCDNIKFSFPSYQIGELVATRKAYGYALRAVGSKCINIVSLDAEVKNSTYAEIFEKSFPNRFVQCFIAEQNMVSMGVGFQKRGAIPFISTFGAFFSRAFDQIRMAAISKSPLRLVGSHAGISIGQDGPSQMALEDIALMRSLPGSVVLYPSDAVSTNKLIACMTAYEDGISYMRTTRMDTPVIYSSESEFRIGGLQVLKESNNDRACVVAAGVTLFEALKAYDILQNQGIAISIIDLYSIKPLDSEAIINMVYKSGKRLITVEDHYLPGGIGQAVTYAVRNEDFNISCLAVTMLPRSGRPDELLSYARIDAQTIINAVHEQYSR